MAEEKPASTELVGWFWAPGEETEKLPGSLTTEPGGKMTLRVINQSQSLDSGTEIARRRRMLFHGLPRNWYLGGDCGRLLGVVSGTTVSGRALQDEEITLDDCLLLTPAWLSEPSDIKFIVNRAYIGVALAPDEELQCERAQWVAEGIEGWLNPSGPSVSERHYWERPATSVTTMATIRGLGQARVTLGLRGGFSREKGNVYEITESGSASVIVDQPTPWSKAAELVYHTHRFLRFALDRLCGVSQLMVQVNGRSVEIVEQTMRQGEARPYRPGQVRFDALFTADPKERGVVGDAESVLRTWLELPFAAQGTLLRLQGLMASSEFVDTQVVSACGAGELWYTQILSVEDDVAVETAEPLPDEVRETVAHTFAENGWGGVYARRIERILDAPNELSTGEKVRRVFDPIEREVLGLTPEDECEVSSALLKLRHPWSHGDIKLDEGLRRLSELVKRARAILKLRVLEHLGVDWRVVARYNKTIQWELGTDQRWHSLPYPVYAGMSALDASLQYLRWTGGRKTLAEITDAIVGGGWQTPSKKPSFVVSDRLTKHMKDGGPVERTKVRGKVYWRFNPAEAD